MLLSTFETIPFGLFCGSLDCVHSAPRSLCVQMRNTISKLLLLLVWMSGRFPSLFRTQKLLYMCIDVLIRGHVNDCGSAIWASALLCGKMTERSDASYSRRLASTVFQLMEAGNSLVSSDCYCMTDCKNPDGRESPILWLIAFWTSVLWDVGGSSAAKCKIMMSILESGFPQVHLARLNPIICASTESGPVESGRREDAEPVSEPPQTSEPIASGSGSHHQDSSPQLRREDLDPLSDPENWELLDEEVVFAECHDLVEPDLIQPGCSVDFVEIDSERPIVQIGPAVFEGCYEDVMGTIVCIEVNKADQRNKTNSLRGPLGPPSSKCQHENQQAHSIPLLKTFKRLNLSRVFLKPRCES